MPPPLPLVVMITGLVGAGNSVAASHAGVVFRLPFVLIWKAYTWPPHEDVSKVAWYTRVVLLIEPLLTEAADADPARARIALKAFDSWLSSCDGLVTKK